MTQQEENIQAMACQHDAPEVRTRRFIASSGLRLVSSALQAWGGISGNQSALVIEAGEEFTDSLTYGAAAVEAHSEKKGLVQKARNVAISFALGAASLASIETVTEIAHDGNAFFKPIEGIDLANNQFKAAIGALAINSVVFFLNRNGLRSDKQSDKFAFRDSIRDSLIPGAVLSLSAVHAPHIAEYAFETSGVTYGWYNAWQLFKGWRRKPSRDKQ